MEIKNIVIPINPDDGYLAMVKQLAELAAQHNATMHLVHIIGHSTSLPVRLLTGANAQASDLLMLEEKKMLLLTWSRWIMQEYKVKVTVHVDKGSWRKKVLQYAAGVNADIITLKEEISSSFLRFYQNRNIQYVLSRSVCQVITFLSNKEGVNEWHNVVIPVSDSLPIDRITAIVQLAKRYKIKLHLISSNNDSESDEILLTNSLKLIKSIGDIPVECKYLPMGNTSNIIKYLRYAHQIQADIIMTNNKFRKVNVQALWQNFKSLFRGYRHEPQLLLR